jgi:hypothetical protein
VAENGNKWPKIDFFYFFEKVSFLTIFVVRMSLVCFTTWKTWKYPKEVWKYVNFDQLLPTFCYILWIYITFWKKLVEEGAITQGYIVRFGQCSVFLIPINKRQPLEISVVLSRWGRCTVVNSAPIVKRSWNQEKHTLPWPCHNLFSFNVFLWGIQN